METTTPPPKVTHKPFAQKPFNVALRCFLDGKRGDKGRRVLQLAEKLKEVRVGPRHLENVKNGYRELPIAKQLFVAKAFGYTLEQFVEIGRRISSGESLDSAKISVTVTEKKPPVSTQVFDVVIDGHLDRLKKYWRRYRGDSLDSATRFLLSVDKFLKHELPDAPSFSDFLDQPSDINIKYRLPPGKK